MRLLHTAIIALIAASSLVSLAYPSFSADEYEYMNLAEKLLHGTFLQYEQATRAPLFPIVLGAAYSVFGVSEFVPKLLNVFIGLLGVLLLYVYAKRNFGEKVAKWSALLLLTNSFYVFFFTRAFSEPLFIALSIACLYFLTESLQKPKFFAFLGISSALLVLSRYNGLAFLPAFALVLLLQYGERLPLKHAALGIASFLAFVSPYLLASYEVTGNPIGLPAKFLSIVASIPTSAHPTGIPDKIPSYFLAFPLALGFSLAAIIAGIYFGRKNLRIAAGNWRKEVFGGKIIALWLPLLFSLASLEFGILLKELRYAVVLLPFIIVPSVLLVQKALEKKLVKNILLACLLLSALAGLAVAFYFGAVYEKQAVHADAGKFLQENCASVFSNAPFITFHYLHKEEVEEAACVFYSLYEYKSVAVDEKLAKGEYVLAYEKGKARVFGRKGK